MPRALRIIVEHECYHVINRTNSGQQIFGQLFSYTEFKTLLEKYAKKFAVCIYHYVLMPNHVHLLLEPTQGNLPRFMQGLTLTCAQRFRRREKTHGHLWQGRYKSLHVDKDAYFIECGKYIELNPVRAGIVEDPSMYPWSSYHAYAWGINDPIVTLDQFYLDLAKMPMMRQTKYRDLINPSLRMMQQIQKKGSGH